MKAGPCPLRFYLEHLLQFLVLYFSYGLARLMSPTFENNIFAQVSFVMLIGMAAKNAILIVEFANDEFKEGLSLFDAAIKAAKSSFRPILMTAFSFILGVFPLGSCHWIRS